MERIAIRAWSKLAVAAALALPALAAQAAHIANDTWCASGGTSVGAMLNAVESAIGSASFTQPRDQVNLLAKLNAAAGKAAVRKWDDAIAKLEDISNTATALANAAKPKLAGADLINSAVLAAQGCMLGLP